MRLSLTVFLCAMACISMVSCEKQEWTTFEPLEFDIKGIELDYSGFEYLGVIPSGGAEFVLTRAGKYAEQDWSETIYVDGVLQISEDDYHRQGPTSGYVVKSGEWGTARHYKKDLSYYSEFMIAPNETDMIREIVIHAGWIYEKADIKITQLPKGQQE